jgi:hypothetical protein
MLVAVSAAVASCFVAVLSFVLTRRNQRELETLRAELEDKRRERDARRDYEYEARKRLYAECGPVLLHLHEAADSALRRIAGLARTAHQGNLGPDLPSWLGDSRSYFFTSTLYMLFAPLAVAKLLQRRLTLSDFSLDRGIYVQYALARELLDSFSSDYRLASRSPELPYRLDPTQAAAVEELAGEGYERRQGIHRGLVDAVTETLLVFRDDVPQRIRGFAEFESEYRDESSPLGVAFRRIEYVLTDFHPRTHPVCWRMLIAQAHLYWALQQTRAGFGAVGTPTPTWVMPDDLRRRFDWRTTDEPCDDPCTVAAAYLEERIGPIADGPTSIVTRGIGV